MKKKAQKKGLAIRIIRKVFKVILYGFLLSVLYILFCKWMNPPVTITQLGSVFSGYGLRRDYISYNKMGSQIKLAVMAGEDQLFPDHNGFDFKSIQKAMKHNQTGKSLRGASTISQQVAKNVFLWQHGGFFRKGLEVYFTFMIEKLWSKKRILEMYLNVAEMGKGVFGVEAAAQYYFKKPAKSLTAKEAAMIASCL
ncbi:MAG: monofunctional biosynthetic peptidoglycan transglycosylase, partial [Ginsengibacter sp.]